MNYVLQDTLTNKNVTYYYGSKNKQSEIVTDLKDAYVYENLPIAKNVLNNNLSKETRLNYCFEVVRIQTKKSPIGRNGKITYTYQLNIPDSPLENTQTSSVIGSTMEQIQKKKKSAYMSTMLSDDSIEVKKQEIYENLNQKIENIKSEINNLKDYKEVVSQELSHCDKEINDIQHFIEFNKLNAANGYIIYRDLHNLLNQRRELKNTLKIIDEFQASTTTLKKFVLKERIMHYKENKNNAQYNPRTEEFAHLFL